jgi:hypothetical protein
VRADVAVKVHDAALVVGFWIKLGQAFDQPEAAVADDQAQAF